MTDERPKRRKPATGPQLYRLAQLGLLEIRDEPGAPLDAARCHDVLAEAAEARLWKPTPRKSWQTTS